MRPTLELPRLSLAERDRRYAAVRKQMAARGLDAIVLWGWPVMWDFYTANARYLSPIGGNAEYNVLIFPADGEPTSIVQMPTFLDGWSGAQNWVSDIRPRTKTWADSVAEPHQGAEARARQDRHGRPRRSARSGRLAAARRLQAAHGAAARREHRQSRRHAGEDPRRSRATRSSACSRKAAALGDLMLATCRDVARPGVKECEVYGAMMETMLANGGEEPTLVPVELRPLSLSASVPRADHAADGEGRPDHLRDASEVRRLLHPCRAHLSVSASRSRSSSRSTRAASRPTGAALRRFGPGKTISTALDGGARTRSTRAVSASARPASTATVSPRWNIRATATTPSRPTARRSRSIGDRFEPGMVFAFNIDLFDPKWRHGKTGCVFAETIEITATGARRMHTFPTEFQRVVALTMRATCECGERFGLWSPAILARRRARRRCAGLSQGSGPAHYQHGRRRRARYHRAHRGRGAVETLGSAGLRHQSSGRRRRHRVEGRGQFADRRHHAAVRAVVEFRFAAGDRQGLSV